MYHFKIPKLKHVEPKFLLLEGRREVKNLPREEHAREGIGSCQRSDV
jgi:hypothetical protein